MFAQPLVGLAGVDSEKLEEAEDDDPLSLVGDDGSAGGGKPVVQLKLALIVDPLFRDWTNRAKLPRTRAALLLLVRLEQRVVGHHRLAVDQRGRSCRTRRAVWISIFWSPDFIENTTRSTVSVGTFSKRAPLATRG